MFHPSPPRVPAIPRSLRLAGPEQQPVADLEHDLAEADRLQPGEEGGGLDRVVGVALVVPVQPVAGQAVGADERPAGPQRAERPGQDRVLHGARRHVVQHGEHADRVEGLVRIGERAGVPGDRLHVRPREPLPERGGCLGLELDGDKALDPVPQPLRRRPRPRPDLQQVVAEVDAARDDGQDLLVQERRPFGRAQQFMPFVHTISLAVALVRISASRPEARSCARSGSRAALARTSGFIVIASLRHRPAASTSAGLSLSAGEAVGGHAESLLRRVQVAPGGERVLVQRDRSFRPAVRW